MASRTTRSAPSRPKSGRQNRHSSSRSYGLSAKALLDGLDTNPSCDDVLRVMRALGTETHRATYERHGGGQHVFGVKFSDLYAFRDRIGVNHDLARSLRDSDVFDANLLAPMIADPESAKKRELDAWARTAVSPLLTEPFAQYVILSPLALDRFQKWSGAALTPRNEFVLRSGYALVWVGLREAARPKPDERVVHFPRATLDGMLDTIERDIHIAPNRAKEGMNFALIATGIRCEPLRKKALAVAKRIGRVEIDHGDSKCRDYDAVTEIQKAADG